ncbi:conserved protein of unknown function [Shewanella benthica]|uniref:Uncharacterized protein n=1 Tax=Shewanella benthica TaxID=43661 RepID=A0A330M8H7_9GAMM|nr:conserved protein of unknown function [Shewanella benthica]
MASRACIAASHLGYTNSIKFMTNSESLRAFNSRRIVEVMVIPFQDNEKQKWKS